MDYRCFLKADMVKEVEEFLRKYGEGAFVMLRLLYVAQTGGNGLVIDNCGEFSMIEQPAIDGVDPLEVFRLLKKVGDFLESTRYDRAKMASVFRHFDFKVHRRMWPDKYRNYDKPGWLLWTELSEDVINRNREDDMAKAGFWRMWDEWHVWYDKIDVERREDVRFLRRALEKKGDLLFLTDFFRLCS